MRVALLYQALDPPLINGGRKPKKPGGYQDSGSDIACLLRQHGLDVITPQANVTPKIQEGWCFEDTEEGILSAVHRGATCLWANTIVFSKHPLQTSRELDEYATQIKVVGQPPQLVEAYDDKNLVNSYLRRLGRFTMPKGCVLHDCKTVDGVETQLAEHKMKMPLVAKPIRGRGSQGVKLCHTLPELTSHVESLGMENAMVEEFLEGPEGTVTVMPPSSERPEYWALPIVARFNHDNGVVPYNGDVAATANSRVLTPDEIERDPAIATVCRECEAVAELLQATAPIRIDVRKPTASPQAPYVMFDVNMKPNMSVPGRPGREDQASLTAMAAEGLGWNATDLLLNILATAISLKELRAISVPAEVYAKG